MDLTREVDASVKFPLSILQPDLWPPWSSLRATASRKPSLPTCSSRLLFLIPSSEHLPLHSAVIMDVNGSTHIEAQKVGLNPGSLPLIHSVEGHIG